MDIFSQNQHWLGGVGSIERPVNWDVTFQLTIAHLGRTCLVLSPWKAPLPLQRAWVLWEVLCSVAANSDGLTVQVPPSEAVTLEQALLQEFDAIDAAISQCDSRQAECFTPDDTTMIHAAIESSVGHTELNQLVIGQLRAWLVVVGRDAIQKAKGAANSGAADGTSLRRLEISMARLLGGLAKFEEMESLCRSSLLEREAAQGPDHPDTLECVSKLGFALQRQAKHSEAEANLRRALAGQEAALGPNHANTLVTAYDLATLLLEHQAKPSAGYQEVGALYRRVLKGREDTLGAAHLETLHAMNGLAQLLKREGKFEETEALCRRRLQGCEALLGAAHPQTLMAMNNLASMLKELNPTKARLDETEALFRGALQGQREQLGEHHFSTLVTQSNLAMLLKARGRKAEAETLFRHILQLRERILGPAHPFTLRSLNSLGLLLNGLGRHKEAEPLLRRTMEGQEKMVGPAHPHTLTALSNLAVVLKERGKFEEAEALYRRALEGLQGSLGPEHPETLTVMLNVADIIRTRLDEVCAREPRAPSPEPARKSSIGPKRIRIDNVRLVVEHRARQTTARLSRYSVVRYGVESSCWATLTRKRCTLSTNSPSSWRCRGIAMRRSGISAASEATRSRAPRETPPMRHQTYRRSRSTDRQCSRLVETTRAPDVQVDWVPLHLRALSRAQR